MNDSIERKLGRVVVCFLLLLLGLAAVVTFVEMQDRPADTQAEQLVAINELEQLARQGEWEQLSMKSMELRESIKNAQRVSRGSGSLWLFGGLCVVFVLLLFGYVYFAILRPFSRMKQFAEQVAQGNLDVPLQYERSNYFGAFTWAFDNMRREITKARSCEKEAVENNKTVIATLSHDIKTPIASIRAYTEGLEANLDSTPEKRQKYLNVIMKKCDEVSRLTNDLFLHSLSDLDKLKINPEKVELCSFLTQAVEELTANQQDVTVKKPEGEMFLLADGNRLLQIMENLVNNARKYARSQIELSLSVREGMAELRVRDYGPGIPDEDLPFICDKFYRGKNCGKEQGSGLGLYIVSYITKQMHGAMRLKNLEPGLEVVLEFPMLEVSLPESGKVKM